MSWDVLGGWWLVGVVRGDERVEVEGVWSWWGTEGGKWGWMARVRVGVLGVGGVGVSGLGDRGLVGV